MANPMEPQSQSESFRIAACDALRVAFRAQQAGDADDGEPA